MGHADHLVTTVEQLEAIYGQPYGPSLAKEIDYISPAYRRLIEAAPFVAVATGGPEGLDCSPKGDAPGFVRILDDKLLHSLYTLAGAATTASTATAISCAIRASPCCFSFPALARLCG